MPPTINEAGAAKLEGSLTVRAPAATKPRPRVVIAYEVAVAAVPPVQVVAPIIESTVVGPVQTAVAPTPGQIAVEAARSQIGVPYRYAASTPGVAFDCSGLTLWAWSVAGQSDLPHKASRQYRTLTHIEIKDLQPGDLVFLGGLGHVGIYTGDLTVVHSPRSGETVVEVPLTNRWVLAARPGL